MKEGALQAPEPIVPHHDLSGFESGEESLDEWLRKRALRNEKGGASRTYVVCEKGSHRVVAYYCLATGAVSRPDAPSRVRRNMPNDVPVMVLGRLAVDRQWQAKGLGGYLLRDAILRTLEAAEIAGVRAILVRAISEEARRFYERHDFDRSPVDEMTLMLTLDDARRALRQAT